MKHHCSSILLLWHITFLLWLAGFFFCSPQSPSTPSGRCAKASSLRSSSATQRAASTPTAASACTMENTWSPWTWCPALERRHGPGSQASSIWWLASVMKTAWPRDSAPGTNILQLYSGVRSCKNDLKTMSYIMQFHDQHTYIPC